MEALYLLVPMSVVVVFVAVWIFFRASDSGQFDDMVGPAMRILQDNDRTEETASSLAKTSADNKAKD
ncbi:MAG TPA: cbb3-type cytochrome oxidase assembly protein CcoS [Noviherbaspirillum sp.]|nr:cbb3-type cytochrome oxidase assembly protein CcoS [Noviherbaspirillum sp.]